MVGQTDIHTHKHQPDYFFPATHQRKSLSIKAPILTHLSLYTDAGIVYHTALCQNRRFSSLLLYASGGIRTHDHSISDLAILPLSVRVERCFSRPYRSRHSCAKCKSQTTCHVPLTGVKGARPSLTLQLHLPTHGDYRLTMIESNPSTGLVCRPDERFLARLCAIARGTCQVQQIGLQQAPSSFRRSGASNQHSPVSIGPAVRAPEAKMLGHIH